jgi:ankyrin repeat protein
MDTGARARAALAKLQGAHPGDSPGRLMQRAIEQDDPDAVLGVAEHTDLDINAPCDEAIEDSASPLFTALRAGNARLTELLAARPGLSLERSMPAYDAWGWATTAPPEVVATFVRLFADAAGRPDADGVTLLHAAAEDPAAGDKVELLLAQPGVDPDARQADGTSPLYRAALAGNLAALRLLLGRSVDVNNRNADNAWTALMIAAAAGRDQIVSALLEQPAIAPDARGDRAQTALHLAAEGGHERVVELLAGPADVNAQESLGRTPLSLAAFAGHEGVVRRLLARADTDPNLVDRDRRTALHWAAMAGHAGIVRLLLHDSRTNAGITNRPERQTAREVAHAAGHAEAAELLDERMRTNPGSDELSAGDRYEERTEDEEETFLAKPLIPEPPGLRGRYGR